MQYLCWIRYLGTHFRGFQVQPEGRTVQGELTAAAERIFGVPVRVTGCSRTDAGVHANCFVATVAPECGVTFPAERLPLAFGAHLPRDVSVMRAMEVEDGFHPRYRAVGKEYVYRIQNSRVADPFLQGRAWYLPRLIGEDGLERMREVASLWLGKHDFRGFMAAGSDMEDTVRCVNRIEISRKGDILSIRVGADGFLYKMVRIMVGSLVDAAFGRMDGERAMRLCTLCDRSLAGPTAPPEGLYLDRVFYAEEAISAFLEQEQCSE